MTRKLTIRTKLAAALAIPLTALAAFAALQVKDAYERADQVKRQAGLATSSTSPTGVVRKLDEERRFQILRALDEEYDKDAKSAIGATNRALNEFEVDVRDLGGDAAGSYESALNRVRTRIDDLRDDDEKLAAKPSDANAKSATLVFDEYTELMGSLLDADQALSMRIDDADLRSGAELLNAMARQHDVEARIAIKAVLASISGDPVAAQAVQRLGGVQVARDADLHTRAEGRYARAIAPRLDARKESVAALQAIAANPEQAQLDEVLATVEEANLLNVASNVGGEVNNRAASMKAAAQNEQLMWIIVTIACVLLAIALLWLTNRWITRPLRSLADQAKAMAGEGLPYAVSEILDTPLDDEIVTPEVEPVRLRAGGEILEVETALNKVQESAIGLAVEQAQLRRNVADAYVNLGRRNQNLLSRQLEFITQLENEESDPDTLEHLFRLDHLATRMRRNAESLLVLAGHAPPRTWTAPVDIGDIVRGALGEVEGYRRVRLRHLDDAHVDGTAAADVSHVVAELVENACSFSPPDSEVEVYGRRDEYGYVLTIVDSGIGMSGDDLERANELIATANALTFAPSRYLGHYVVAQLAARHDLAVHLVASPAGGITAMVALPGPVIGLAAAPVDDVDGADTADAVTTEPVEGQDAVDTPDVPVAPIAALPRRGAVAPVAFDAIAPDAEPEPPLALVPPLAPEAEAEAPPFVWLPEPEVAPEPEPVFEAVAPEAEPEPYVAPEVSAAPEPEPTFGVAALAAELAAVQESAPAFTPEPEPEVAPAPVADVAPPAPARTRLGLGSFADLRGTNVPPPPVEATASPAAPEVEAPAPGASVPVAAADPPPLAHPELDHVADQQETYAEVAEAVNVAVTHAPVPASEDLLPRKLPKRGRKDKKGGLQEAWTRDRPAKAVAPATPLASDPPPINGLGAEGAMHFGPDGQRTEQSTEDAVSAANGEANEERFAFFAAFRAAAERAREEAGIDERRPSR